MRLAVIAVFVLFASSASAQTVEAVIDLNALGWGPVTGPQSVETDGDLTTFEWLVRRLFTNQMRVVAERGDGICAGPWFDPAAGDAQTIVTVQRRGLTHILVVAPPRGQALIVSLDTPVCEPQH